MPGALWSPLLLPHSWPSSRLPVLGGQLNAALLPLPGVRRARGPKREGGDLPIFVSW
jgi:hypothetical protein